MIPYIATVMALVIYALQTKLILRVRSLRAAEGAHFDAGYWQALMRLSGLHMLLAMIAVIGIITSASLIAAPNGFGGPNTANPLALGLAVASIFLIVINIPFIIRVERIGTKPLQSAVAVVIALGVYLSLFLGLFFDMVAGVGMALVLALVVWLVLGGWRLVRSSRVVPAAA
jgi:hypothetical protein